MRIGTVVVTCETSSGSAASEGTVSCWPLQQRGHELHLFARRWDEAAARNLICHRLPAPDPRRSRRLSSRCRHSSSRVDGDPASTSCTATPRVWATMSCRQGAAPTARTCGRSGETPGGARAAGPGARRTARASSSSSGSSVRPAGSSPTRRGAAGCSKRPIPSRRAGRCVYNGVDTKHFSPRSATSSGPRPGAVWAWRPGRSCSCSSEPGFIAKACWSFSASARSTRRGARPSSVAGRSRRPAVDRTIRRLRLDGRVICQDFASDPRPYYAAADVFVLPTKFDPFSNATAEAMACGLPVITTAANGVASSSPRAARASSIRTRHDIGALGQALARMLEAIAWGWAKRHVLSPRH